jgi:hypothetical protein
MVIELDEAAVRQGVRVVDFQPKAADIVDFTRGQATQKYELASKLSAGPAPAAAVPVSGDLSYTQTEQFARDLKDAIERRSAGVHDGGKGFYAEFRSIREVRIAGTYSFSLMLEVPARIYHAKDSAVYESLPVVEQLLANVALVGVVRHVHDRGKTGWFVRVPEPENDDVYEQVVLVAEENRPIWRFDGESWTRPIVLEQAAFELTVVTNVEDASFIVRSGDTILGFGSSSKNQIKLSMGSTAVAATVDFLDIVRISTQGSPTVLSAPSAKLTIPKKGDPAKGTAYGVYRPK